MQLSNEAETFAQLIENKEASSAKGLASGSSPCSKLLMLLRKKEFYYRAFKKIPIGYWPFKTTLWCLLWKKDWNRSIRLPFISLLFNLHGRPSCKLLSNALYKSKKTPRTSNEALESNEPKILWLIEISWFTLGLFSLKPDKYYEGCLLL